MKKHICILLVLSICSVIFSASTDAKKPSYTAIPSATEDHPDTSPPSKLLDEKWHSALEESVEYPDDVTITVDMGETKKLGVVRIRAYQKSGDYEVAQLSVSLSDDKSTWEKAGSMSNAVPDWKGGDHVLPVDLYVDIDGKARYVKLQVTKAADAKRILLGEIVVGPEPEPIGQLDTKAGVWVYEYATMPGGRGEPKKKIKTVMGKVDVYELLDYARHDPALKGDPTHRHFRIDPVKPHWVYQMPNFEFIPADKEKAKEDAKQNHDTEE